MSVHRGRQLRSPLRPPVGWAALAALLCVQLAVPIPAGAETAMAEVAAATAGASAAAEPAAPAEAVSKKRAAPARVKPVVHDGVRYSAGRAGLLRATRVDTGALLWELEVYGLQGDPDLETDKREVDIIALQLHAKRHHLQVRNARGQRFCVDLRTRQVQPQGSPGQ